MRAIEQRAELDDFELADHYDFSDGIRGRFYQSRKITTTIQLDNDILLFLKKQASERHTDYQTILNTLLRDYMSGKLSPASK
jgi:predicted DNA binding CopG/RHH family protein